MRRIGSLTTTVALAALPVLAIGCVPQDKYDSLLTANRSLEEQVVSLEDQREECRASLRAVQERLDRTSQSYDSLQARYEQLDDSFGSLEAQNEDYLNRIASLEIGPLPIEIETAIEDLARDHPELLSFDAQRGLLRFASDFTFDLGSTELTTDARQTLRTLASILTESAARDLEVKVIGHTDNVPIEKPATKRNHPTNVHLSVHRAIAVRDVLTGAGVYPARIQVAGYGEYRPIVPNGPRGAAENRRVEIYLAPMTRTEMRAAREGQADRGENSGGGSSVVAEPETDEPMK
jgi:chemotaxis protein MotB